MQGANSVPNKKTKLRREKRKRAAARLEQRVAAAATMQGDRGPSGMELILEGRAARAGWGGLSILREAAQTKTAKVLESPKSTHRELNQAVRNVIAMNAQELAGGQPAEGAAAASQPQVNIQVNIDPDFYGNANRLAQITAADAASAGSAGVAGADEGGSVRPAVGQNGHGPNGHDPGPRAK